MNVTDFEFYAYRNQNSDSSALGSGAVTFDDILKIRVVIRRGKDGQIFVGWPGGYGKDKENEGKDKWYDAVFFHSKQDKEIGNQTRKSIEAFIIDEVNKKLAVVPKNTSSDSPKPLIAIRVNKSSEQNTASSAPFDPDEIMDEDDRIFNEELRKR